MKKQLIAQASLISALLLFGSAALGGTNNPNPYAPCFNGSDVQSKEVTDQLEAQALNNIKKTCAATEPGFSSSGFYGECHASFKKLERNQPIYSVSCGPPCDEKNHDKSTQIEYFLICTKQGWEGTDSPDNSSSSDLIFHSGSNRPVD